MGKIYKSAEELIGRTPVVELGNIEKGEKLNGTLLAKLEMFNPGGSAKDRVGLNMINDAEKKGLLKPDSVIIEPTSGNTGIGLALIAAIRGYRAIIVMPETMSEERKLLMKAYGAELELTKGELGMAGAIARAKELKEQLPGSIIAGQFDNPANPEIHEKTTGPEIFEDCGGKVDIFVAGVGTGGTITGVGRYLKSVNPDVKIVAVEPAGSPFLSEGKAGKHDLQGIGAGFVPGILDTSVYDEIITVTDEQAYEMGRKLARSEGILCGITSGAAAFAAAQLLKRPENAGKTVVAFLPDTGERYLSTKMFL